MPFLRFDVLEGWSPADLSKLLDTAHSVVVDIFGVPPRDRYQVIQQHPADLVRMEDTGLGIERSPRQIFLQVTSRPRARDKKVAFYQTLASRLEAECGISPDDLVVNIVENSDADWSFGRGAAQFLTGELG